jgi:hypothetical protein
MMERTGNIKSEINPAGVAGPYREAAEDTKK